LLTAVAAKSHGVLVGLTLNRSGSLGYSADLFIWSEAHKGFQFSGKIVRHHEAVQMGFQVGMRGVVIPVDTVIRLFRKAVAMLLSDVSCNSV